jgi:hypothetical protein
MKIHKIIASNFDNEVDVLSFNLAKQCAVSKQIDSKKEIKIMPGYHRVNQLDVIYQSKKNPQSVVIIPANIFHQLKDAYVHLVQSCEKAMSDSATDKPNYLTAALTFIVTKSIYQGKNHKENQKRKAITVPFCIPVIDGKKTPFLSVGYSIELGKYDENRFKRDYELRFRRGKKVLGEKFFNVPDNPQHINHTEQSVLQDLMHSRELSEYMKEELGRHGVKPKAKIYGVVLDFFSKLDMCNNCQVSTLGAQNSNDDYGLAVNDEIKLPKGMLLALSDNLKDEYVFSKNPKMLTRFVWLNNTYYSSFHKDLEVNNMKDFKNKVIISSDSRFFSKQQNNSYSPEDFSLMSSTTFRRLSGQPDISKTNNKAHVRRVKSVELAKKQ